MMSRILCLAILVLVTIHSCLGQSPFGAGMFSGGQSAAGGSGGAGGMGMMWPWMFSGLDFNKIMYMMMLSNGGLGGGMMLPGLLGMNLFN